MLINFPLITLIQLFNPKRLTYSIEYNFSFMKIFPKSSISSLTKMLANPHGSINVMLVNQMFLPSLLYNMKRKIN